MTVWRWSLLVVLATALSPDFAHAKEVWTNANDHIAIKTLIVNPDGGAAPTLHLTFFVRAKVWLLLGEPVVYCDAAVQASVFAPNTLRPPYNKIGTRVILQNIDVYDVDITFKVHGPYGDTSARFHCDIGAPGRVYLPPMGASFMRLSPKDRERHFSFNVPGSPNWDKLFFSAVGKLYEEKRAQEHFNASMDKRMRLRILGFPPAPKVPDFQIRARVSATGVEMIAARHQRDAARTQLERERERWKREDAARRADLARRASRLKTVEGRGVAGQGDPFWSSPDDVSTPAQKKTRARVEEATKKLAQREQQLHRARSAFVARRAKVRREVANRSKGLAERVCQRSHNVYNQCISKACGGWPHYPIHFTTNTCDKACQAASAKRIERKLRSERDAWRRCASIYRPRCSKKGASDKNKCVSNFKLTPP